LSQSFIPIGFALIGSITLGLTGVHGGLTGIGSSVSGIIGVGLAGIGWGVTGGGEGVYLLKRLSKQHKRPSNPKSPKSPGHHLQQSLSFLY